MTKCPKCGSIVFFVDESTTYLEVDGEIIKELGVGDYHKRTCVKCCFPLIYEIFKILKKDRSEKHIITLK